MKTLMPKVFSMLHILDEYSVHIIAAVFYGLCYSALLPYAQGHHGSLLFSAFIIWVMGILPVTFAVATVVGLLSDLVHLVRHLFQPKH